MARRKITVVGGGMVGASTAQRLVEKELGDVVLVDIVEGIPQGKALDMAESAPILGYDARLTGTNTYEETANSDVVVITAGIPRKPGMTRDDLLRTNAAIVKSVTEQVVKYSPNTIIIVVSNPLDAMTYVAQRVSGFPSHRVIGMGGVLDTSRFKSFLAWELDVSVENIQALVLGCHCDTMVPVLSCTDVAGIPVTRLIPLERLRQIVQRTREAGAEIVRLLKTGSAYYAPSAAAADMVETILKDKKKIVPAAAMLEGHYGFKDVIVGVPVKLGAHGIEEIYEVELTDEERGNFNDSVEIVRELLQRTRQLVFDEQ